MGEWSQRFYLFQSQKVFPKSVVDVFIYPCLIPEALKVAS